MFDSPILNVAIGLVLVYLLYSLLLTILSELIATKIGLRNRVLRLSIERMLNDGFYVELEQFNNGKKLKKPKEKYSWLDQFLLREHPSFNDSLAGRFYDNPSIKYLSRLEQHKARFFKTSQTRPAYFSAENFADTMISMFRDKGTGNDDISKVAFAIRYNTLGIQQETAKHIKDLLANSNNDITQFRVQLMKWFNETQDRANGWYKDKLRYILFFGGLILAISFNVDTIRIAKLLAKDKKAQEEMVNMGIALAKDPTRYYTYRKHRDNDTVRSQTVVNTSYNQVVQDINEANAVLGSGWHSDSVNSFIYSNVPLSEDSLKNMFTSPVKTSVKKMHAFEKLQYYVYGLVSFSCNIWPHDTVMVYTGKKDINGWQHACHVALLQIPYHYAWLGLLITALMLSLGAPFWFDLLNKLVSIRGSGIKPEEKKDNTSSQSLPPDLQTAPVGNVVKSQVTAQDNDLQSVKAKLEDTAQQLAIQYKGVPGIIRIVDGFTRINGFKQPAIEVHIDKSISAAQLDYIKKMIPDMISGFHVEFLMNSHGSLHSLCVSQAIMNNTPTAPSYDTGTLSCFVTSDKYPGKTFLMSCWHVLKNNTDWHNNTGGMVYDFNNGNNPIANITEGNILPTFDAGFAEVNASIGCTTAISGVKYNWRAPLPVDEFNETPISFTGITSGQVQAQVDKISAQWSVVYMGTEFQFNDLMRIKKYVDNISIGASASGDSGALVADNNGYPLGILIGGDEQHSYVAKFCNIFANNSPFNNYKLII